MRNRRHDLSVSRVIAFQFVREEPARFTALAFDQAAKEADGGLFIASPLHKDINGVAILINRLPEVLMFALNGDDGFIDVPRITQAALALLECARLGRTKLQTPLSDTFIRDENAAFSQELFDFTKAETEAMIEPHGVADDFRRETVALVAGLFGVQRATLPKAG